MAVRAVPGEGLESRRQVGDLIQWSSGDNDLLKGSINLQFTNADQAIVMLLIGKAVVRRQWFLDPDKARNNRFLSMQHFDKELKTIRHAVLESTESRKFENGIAALLFILGFTAVQPLETDAPDLIVATPGGKLALVECTLRIADFGTKIGKLVDRRGALSKHLITTGHPSPVASVLVCRLPRDQIAAKAEELRTHNTILLSSEDLTEAFHRVRFNNDPDLMLDDAIKNLNYSQMN